MTRVLSVEGSNILMKEGVHIFSKVMRKGVQIKMGAGGVGTYGGGIGR